MKAFVAVMAMLFGSLVWFQPRSADAPPTVNVPERTSEPTPTVPIDERDKPL